MLIMLEHSYQCETSLHIYEKVQAKFGHSMSAHQRQYPFILQLTLCNYYDIDLQLNVQLMFLFFVAEECDAALGMESGGIPATSINATSSYVPNVGPDYGR